MALAKPPRSANLPTIWRRRAPARRWQLPTPSAPRRASSWAPGPSATRAEIISQAGRRPSGGQFTPSAPAGRGARCGAVDTAGRWPTQLHLMEELEDQRAIQKADPSAPHEALLVIDGNTGQNAHGPRCAPLTNALQLTGSAPATKLDGTARCIGRHRAVQRADLVYFISNT